MAAQVARAVLGLVLFAGRAVARASHPESHDFMELSVHAAARGDLVDEGGHDSSREPPWGSRQQVAEGQFSARAGLGAILAAAEGNGTRQLMLGFGLMVLFFICVFMMQETEDVSAAPPAKKKPSTKKLAKSGSSGKLKRASPQDTPVTSPQISAAKLPAYTYAQPADETTLLLDDLRRQEEALKRQEAEAWRRQEEAVRVEKDALLRREDELRARYQRMEALTPKPALYIPSSSPILGERPYNTTPRSAPLYEPYAAREAREKRQVLEATEQAIVQSSPYLSDRRPLGATATSPPPTYSALGSSSSFARETYEQTYSAAGGGGSQLSPVPPATAPAIASSYSYTTPTSSATFSAPAVPATAPSFGEEEMTPEQKVTLQNIMQQTGASREATIRAMKKARAEEEAILRELEARRTRAAAAAAAAAAP